MNTIKRDNKKNPLDKKMWTDPINYNNLSFLLKLNLGLI
jgi:hypothetical protein